MVHALGHLRQLLRPPLLRPRSHHAQRTCRHARIARRHVHGRTAVDTGQLQVDLARVRAGVLLAQARLGEAHCVGIGVGEAQRQSVAQRFQGLPSQLECAGHDVSLGRDGLVELAEGRVCGQRDGHTPDWPADDARYHLQVLQGVGFREGEHDQWGNKHSEFSAAATVPLVFSLQAADLSKVRSYRGSCRPALPPLSSRRLAADTHERGGRGCGQWQGVLGRAELRKHGGLHQGSLRG